MYLIFYDKIIRNNTESIATHIFPKKRAQYKTQTEYFSIA